MLSAPLGGCFGEEEVEEIKENVFDLLCPDGIANNTWYHYSNATDATKVSDVFNGTSDSPGELSGKQRVEPWAYTDMQS